MKRILLLVLCTVYWAEDVSGKLDFSQFYLPPCCYKSPQDQFTGYASSPSPDENNVNANVKREAPLHFKVYKFKASSNKNEISDPEFSKIKTREFKPYPTYFKLDVPLKEVLVGAASEKEPTDKDKSNSKVKVLKVDKIKISPSPPTMGKIMLQENQSRGSRNISEVLQEAFLKSKLLEKIFTLELDTLEDNKPLVGKKSLARTYHSVADGLPLKPEHRTETLEAPTTSESQIVETYHKWEPEKLSKNKINRSLKVDPIMQNRTETGDVKMKNSTINMQDPPSEPVKRQTPKKMPSSWVKHLKRALYQSLTATEGTVEGSPNRNIKQLPEIKHPETWNLLVTAELQFVDPMSQVSSNIHRAIFLPPGEGPVVSGVLVNTNNAELKVRVSSELYMPNSLQRRQDNCHCHLLNPGEILVAYWSISRTFNDNGQAALQYLVYPLPHSVPTTPQLLPFSNDYNMFAPSPIDPLTQYYENIHRTNAVGPSSGPGPSQTPIYPTHTPPNFGNYPETNPIYPPNSFNYGNINPNNQNHNHKDFEQTDHDQPPLPPRPNPQRFYHQRGYRNPKLVHELPNGQHRLEIIPQGYQTNSKPGPVDVPQPPPPQKIQEIDNNGQTQGQMYDENTRQYSPAFIENYNQELQNYFLNQVNMQNSAGGGNQFAIPFLDLNMNRPPGPANYELNYPPTAGPGPTPGQLQIEQGPGPGPTMGPYDNQRQQQIPLLQQPQQEPVQTNPNPTGFPIQDSQFQLQKPPTFPKSIQDIISPDPQVEEELVPSARPQIPQELVNLQQPIMSLPPSPPPYFLAPPAPEVFQEYINNDMLQNLNLLQMQLYNQNQNFQNQGQQQQGVLQHQHQQFPQLQQHYANANFQRNNNNLKKQSLENEKDKSEENQMTDKQNQEGLKNQAQEDDNSKTPPSSSYVISNVRDNEKKYYPVMNSWKSRHYKFHDRRYPKRSHKHTKLAYDIRNKGGYILDF